MSSQQASTTEPQGVEAYFTDVEHLRELFKQLVTAPTLSKRLLIIALRDWWKTGINDVGTPRPDTISPIPEGIALIEAEHSAREREPGDGSPQKTVVEQIEEALR